nr:uncharacterized protein LOC112744904 isoform X3 [Arachis hypogaea]XP_029153915.1 uncharacterized protein LOC112798193 isoform X3 [Arachis hypogaea]
MVFLAQVSNLQCSLCLVLSPTRELAQQESDNIRGEDINMSISHAADSIGLKEIPRYEVKIIEEDDWMKGAQVQNLLQKYSLFLEGIEVSKMDDWACVSGRKRKNIDIC